MLQSRSWSTIHSWSTLTRSGPRSPDRRRRISRLITQVSIFKSRSKYFLLDYIYNYFSSIFRIADCIFLQGPMLNHCIYVIHVYCLCTMYIIYLLFEKCMINVQNCITTWCMLILCFKRCTNFISSFSLHELYHFIYRVKYFKNKLFYFISIRSFVICLNIFFPKFKFF